jgi:aspartyl-tRNA(Asn)/glutamyl-tRNA(Gln) amidotransferase subunit C
MAISAEQVRYVAELARLELAPGEEELFTGQLNAILGYMEQLAELDTEGVEPTAHVLDLANVMRDDEPRPCLPTEEALANAPAQEKGHFAVPKIIE